MKTTLNTLKDAENDALQYDSLLCFSHLRWDFVFQRPQHLLTRLTKHYAVYYIEEPKYGDFTAAYLHVSSDKNVTVLVPHLPHGIADANAMQAQLVDEFISYRGIRNFISWYYTPMALAFSRHLKPTLVVYDCMDELSAFKFAPPELVQFEQELLRNADVVFTGGNSLYQAKKHHHNNVYAFPSSIDAAHFGKAKNITTVPDDQAGIPGPVLGFFGVIDERFDIELIREVAQRRTDWHIVLIGPVVKIDEATLPRESNIHYLGSKSYDQLPAYLAGWDIALIPFQLNESTRFISPTKTPEYLAAGIPVISAPIADVIDPYGNNNIVFIAGNGDEFIAAAETILDKKMDAGWADNVSAFIATNSWDITVAKMMEKIENVKAETKKILSCTTI